mgnify:CR=1 FL=1
MFKLYCIAALTVHGLLLGRAVACADWPSTVWIGVLTGFQVTLCVILWRAKR